MLYPALQPLGRSVERRTVDQHTRRCAPTHRPRMLS
jgi:hypothetical protein